MHKAVSAATVTASASHHWRITIINRLVGKNTFSTADISRVHPAGRPNSVRFRPNACRYGFATTRRSWPRQDSRRIRRSTSAACRRRLPPEARDV